MFDIGFLELVIIAVVGLFVIGPERLPGALRTGALWFGRIKRNLLETRREIERQIGADEIRRELHNEQIMHNLNKIKDTRAELESKLKQWEKGETIDHSDAPEALSHDQAEAIAESSDQSFSHDGSAEARSRAASPQPSDNQADEQQAPSTTAHSSNSDTDSSVKKGTE